MKLEDLLSIQDMEDPVDVKQQPKDKFRFKRVKRALHPRDVPDTNVQSPADLGADPLEFD